MRKQYHLRTNGTGSLIWDVERLIELSQSLLVQEVALDSIREFEETYWIQGKDEYPTCREVAEHAKLT